MPSKLPFRLNLTPDSIHIDTSSKSDTNFELELENPTKAIYAWRVRSNSGKSYFIEPNNGVLGAGDKVRIEVEYTPTTETLIGPPPTSDQFLLLVLTKEFKSRLLEADKLAFPVDKKREFAYKLVHVRFTDTVEKKNTEGVLIPHVEVEKEVKDDRLERRMRRVFRGNGPTNLQIDVEENPDVQPISIDHSVVDFYLSPHEPAEAMNRSGTLQTFVTSFRAVVPTNSKNRQFRTRMMFTAGCLLILVNLLLYLPVQA